MRISVRRAGLGAVIAFFSTASMAQGTPGTLDPAFGIGGRLLVDFHGGQDQIEAIAPMKDGRFVAAGFIHGPNAGGPGFSSNFTVARFLADGRLDPTFAEDGVFQIDVDSAGDYANALALQPDGRIVVVGALTEKAYADIAIARLLPDGALDTTFGDPAPGGGRLGFATLDVGGPSIHDFARSVAIQGDGRYLVAGITRVPFGGFTFHRVVVARFQADGSLDTTYGNGGRVVLDPFLAGDGDDIHVSIALTPSERLPRNNNVTLVGYTRSRNNAFIARLTPLGAPDTTFGDTVSGTRIGRVRLTATNSGSVHSGVSAIHAARILANGQIVIAGTGNDRGMTFMRFDSTGALDTTFGTAGRTTVKFSDGSRFDEPFALDIQGNGKIVGAGYATTGSTSDFFITRLRPGGQVDNSFGDGQGRAVVSMSASTDQALAVAIEPSGHILAGGFGFIGSTTSTSDFAIARVFGDPDRIFFHDFERPVGN